MYAKITREKMHVYRKLGVDEANLERHNNFQGKIPIGIVKILAVLKMELERKLN